MRIDCFCLIRYSTGKRSLPQAARERNQAEVGVNPFICLLPTYRYRKQLLSPIFWSMSRTNIFGFSFPSRFANSPFCAHFLYLTNFPKLYLFSSSFLLPLYRTVLSFLKGVNNIYGRSGNYIPPALKILFFPIPPYASLNPHAIFMQYFIFLCCVTAALFHIFFIFLLFLSSPFTHYCSKRLRPKLEDGAVIKNKKIYFSFSRFIFSPFHISPAKGIGWYSPRLRRELYGIVLLDILKIYYFFLFLQVWELWGLLGPDPEDRGRSGEVCWGLQTVRAPGRDFLKQ